MKSCYRSECAGMEVMGRIKDALAFAPGLE